MLPNEHRARFAAAGKLAAIRHRIHSVQERLAAAPHWEPGHDLLARCHEGQRLLDDLEQRLERKLVVALIGPSGAGKSTLLNALAGQNDLSPAGENRPTTRDVVIFCKHKSDSEPFTESLGGEQVRVVSSPAASALESVLIVDTPDIDSDRCPEHRPVVEEVVRNSDVLLCVFNSENPKRLDAVDFLAPLVAVFPSDSLYVVLGHCDRREEQELRDVILPDFEAHLSRAWKRAPEKTLCVSGRRNVASPDWPEGAGPLHDFDEFPALHEVLFESLNQGDVVIDSRIRRAEHILAYLTDSVRERLEPCEAELKSAESAVVDASAEAAKSAVESLGRSSSDALWTIDSILYQRLAQLCWGPHGWLVALWARLLLIGSGLLSLFRPGGAASQARAAASSLLRTGDAGESASRATGSPWVEEAFLEYRAVQNRLWTDSAKLLVGIGFERSVLDLGRAVADEGKLKQRLSAIWESALAAAIESGAKGLGNWWLQVLLNAPVVGVAVMAAYACVSNFFGGDYLPADYFRHAGVTLLLVWLLPFVLFQVLVRSVGGAKLLGRAIRSMTHQALMEELDSGEGSTLHEIRSLLSLLSR